MNCNYSINYLSLTKKVINLAIGNKVIGPLSCGQRNVYIYE